MESMGFFKTKILGTGVFYPKKVVSNYDLAKTLDTSDEWIFERTGIKNRRISSEEGGEYTTDMAYHASKAAIERACLSPNDLDLILFATLTPDYKLPNCASQLQVRLGISNRCAAIDIGAACSGYVYGFNMANAMIQTGMFKNILLVGAETLSREVDWTDRSICILLGDGAGATVIGRNESGDDSEVLSAHLGADGTGRDFFFQEYGGVTNPITPEIASSPKRFMQMQGREMFKVAVRTLSESSLIALKKANLTIDDIDWLIPHQANIRILEATSKLLGLPKEKVIVNIRDYANTSAATIPSALHQGLMEGKIKRGQVILFAAFGAGLTSGSTVFRY